MWDSGFLGQSQKPMTVLEYVGLWQSHRSLGQSRAFRTVPKTQSPDIMGFYF